MAEILALDWVSKLLDVVLLLAFAAVLVVFLRVMWKLPDTGSNQGGAASSPSVQTPKTGNNADVTAAISAAINEYRKNTQ